MTRKSTPIIELNSLKSFARTKSADNVSTTIPGFHHRQDFHGTQVWLVFDNKAPRDVFIEL